MPIKYGANGLHDGTDETKQLAFDVTGVTTGTTRTVTVPDKSGTLAMTSDIGDNPPSFMVRQTSNQTISTSTHTKLALDSEVWDTDSAFDSTTNYRFTVPSGEAGKYHFDAGVYVQNTAASTKIVFRYYKNGVVLSEGQTASEYPDGGNLYATSSVNLDLAVSDYIELYVFHDSGTNEDTSAASTYLSGFKLAGV